MVATVAFPITIDGVYDYLIPDHLAGTIRRGMPVQVNLRSRTLWGVVMEIKSSSPYPNLKPVLAIKSEGWNRASESLITLYQWIASYYHTTVATVFKPIIKKSIADMKAKEVSLYSLAATIPADLTVKQREAVEKILGGVGTGLVPVRVESENSQIPQIENIESTQKNGHPQGTPLRNLKPMTNGELEQRGVSASMKTTLVKLGVLIKSVTTEIRESVDSSYSEGHLTGTLSEEQLAVVEQIWADRENPTKPFLIHGVTGSGKTYIYIELARRTLAEGRGVIILVPEIGLTPQTISRFTNALGVPAAIMHSRMSEGERRDSVEQVVSGARKLVIGVRSSILIPMPNPGLIVVDEEHDGSYKQADPEPRYHARDAAIMRGQFQKAITVLGTATPAMETYFNAQAGKYVYIELKNRFGSAELPVVTLVDMNRERASGNWSPFSRELRSRITTTLAEGKQIILLLNRRGYAVSLACGTCGHIRQCPHCSVNLIYHRSGDEIRCHHCGYRSHPNYKCEACGCEEMQYNGYGIQKVEDQLRELFPQARTIRMDQDTTSRKGAHGDLLGMFARREADILLGTQMVAKGLSFPDVTLVGVLQADTGLTLPDFRASERLFQLLTQVAGRAGRDAHKGTVVVQTMSPHVPAVALAAKHDYEGFYDSEISDRADAGYPPFRRLVRIVFIGKDESAVLKRANQIAGFLRNYPVLEILGPAETLVKKSHDEYRFAVIIKCETHTVLRDSVAQLIKQFPSVKNEPVRYKIDVDPGSMV